MSEVSKQNMSTKQSPGDQPAVIRPVEELGDVDLPVGHSAHAMNEPPESASAALVPPPATKTRTVTEYRVRYKRVGREPIEKRYRFPRAVTDRIGLLTSDEPWRFYGNEAERMRGPNELVCCPGTYHDECSCGGFTVKQAADAKRAEHPPLEWIHVDARQITTTSWQGIDGAFLLEVQEAGCD